ncbi:MAG TPA: magnesium/cobalt transporter CorA [Pirellulales bacterium]|nr:magnesium/cobalt transporter CorA [Pirellulales bacterium]
MSKPRRRRKPHFQRRTAPGAPPGLVVVDPSAPPPVVHLIAYGPEEFEERPIRDLTAIGEFAGRSRVCWVNVAGLGDAQVIGELGRLFGLHPLALEDVVNLHQRAKVEAYDEHLFVVARMARDDGVCDTEQVSLFVGHGFVLTFLEDPGDVFEPVRSRLRGGAGRIRESAPGYLAYALLDAVIDSYFPLIEVHGERLDALEDLVIVRPEQRLIASIHDAKRDLRALRRAIWPLREAMNMLAREASPWFDDETRVHLRDCHDHVVQIIDLVETYRELGSDLTDLYLSSLSHRMNEVMRVLTVIATIFMPISFIAGVYGMNFKVMPELEWPYGYAYALGLIAAATAGMLYFFHRKGWLLPHAPLGESQRNEGE